MKNLGGWYIIVAAAVGVGMLAPVAAEAQTDQPSVQVPDDWELLVRPRFGFYMPNWNYDQGQALPRRPSFGLEIGLRRADGWLGGRLLFDRAFSWNAAAVPGFDQTAGSPRPDHFQSVTGDLVLYPGQAGDLRPYVFGGIGSKALAFVGEVAISPYSLSSSGRTMALHWGAGTEVDVSGALFIVEVGDFYGGSGGRLPFPDEVASGRGPDDPVHLGKLHDIHLTFMVQFDGVGDAIERIVDRIVHP